MHFLYVYFYATQAQVTYIFTKTQFLYSILVNYLYFSLPYEALVECGLWGTLLKMYHFKLLSYAHFSIEWKKYIEKIPPGTLVPWNLIDPLDNFCLQMHLQFSFSMFELVPTLLKIQIESSLKNTLLNVLPYELALYNGYEKPKKC